MNNNLEIYALLTGSGIGTKPLQSFLDGHPKIITIPGYPLVYFYPHWKHWEETLNEWSWDSIVKIFTERHASVIDSRLIPGFNGLATLGDNGDDHVEIDKVKFIKYLKEYLHGKKISSRTFLLGVHIIYAMVSNTNKNNYKIIIFHLHNVQYLRYFLDDFPEGKVISMSRDPRANIGGRIKSAHNVDNGKLNKTDAIIYQKYNYINVCKSLYHDTYNILDEMKPSNVAIVGLENLYYNLEQTMQNLSNWIGIEFNSSMLIMTFSGKTWWGDKVYNMGRLNSINPRVVSTGWKSGLSLIEWFIIEGLSYQIMTNHGYKVEKYKKDNIVYRLILFVLILLPSSYEIQTIKYYFNPKKYIEFLKASINESNKKSHLKDYTINATYLYKWSYIDLKLWKTPMYKRFIINLQKSSDCNIVIYNLCRVNYVVSVHIKLLFSILLYPVTYIKRVFIMYRALYRRFFKRYHIPPLIYSMPLK